MGRKSKKQLEFEKNFNLLEAQYQLAVQHLAKYGNTSLGLKITHSVSPQVAASVLTNRTGHNITVRECTEKPGEFAGKAFLADVVYIAEDNGPLNFGKLGQISLF